MRLRDLMALVLYVALGCAALHAAVSRGSASGLLIFFLLTVFAPLAAGLWWMARHFDRSTFY